MKELNFRLFTALLLHIGSLLVLFAGIYLSVSLAFASLGEGLVIGGILYILLIIYFLYIKNESYILENIIIGMVSSFAMGIIIGAYFNTDSLVFIDYIWLLPHSIIVVIINYILIRLFKLKKPMIIVIAVLIIITMIAVINANDTFIYGLALINIYLISLLIGLYSYLNKGNNFYRYYAAGAMVTFILVFITIIAIVTESEGTAEVAEGFVVIDSDKNNKNNILYK